MRRLLLILGLLLLALIVYVAVARLTVHAIDGLSCDPTEQVNYHVHAHLTIADRGRLSYPPANVGIHLLDHLCLYWLHTHDGSGIIHIEAPHPIRPTLGNFFDIWGQPLSRHRIWTYVVGAGQSMRVYVGNSLYRGDPRRITLLSHTAVTVEIGPPFIAPPKPNFHGL